MDRLKPVILFQGWVRDHVHSIWPQKTSDLQMSFFTLGKACKPQRISWGCFPLSHGNLKKTHTDFQHGTMMNQQIFSWNAMEKLSGPRENQDHNIELFCQSQCQEKKRSPNVHSWYQHFLRKNVWTGMGNTSSNFCSFSCNYPRVKSQ